ncbi:uncharacterized protein TrAFT101_007352 [Trichoderma asperellum]|uniref:uncharacterized protein n=1 Tax=Trichoderma asperellum TaxID=101201 RepID=UPI0033227D48|nr:hypothetical protein TrAFT101_007352 [Trichoderma asperellum]
MLSSSSRLLLAFHISVAAGPKQRGIASRWIRFDVPGTRKRALCDAVISAGMSLNRSSRYLNAPPWDTSSYSEAVAQFARL